MSNLNFPQTVRNIEAKLPSLRSAAIIFVAVFLVLAATLNAPMIMSHLNYSATHSVDADNEALTQQYRALYGYSRGQGTGTAAQPAVQGAGAAQPGEDQLTIPKINVRAPIIQITNPDDQSILSALKSGVVLYPGSVNPGGGGSSIIVGHSSSDLPWTKYSAIFSLLNKLQSGDLIDISFNGGQYVYRVRTVQTGSVQELLASGLTGDLILSSCWPLGTAENRIVVTADLLR